jgi:hypothetical protein
MKEQVATIISKKNIYFIGEQSVIIIRERYTL